MHHAANNQNPQIIKLLMKFDADRDKYRSLKDARGKTAIQLISDTTKYLGCFQNIWQAAREGDLDQIRRVHIQGGDLNCKTLESELTPLHLAVQGQHFLVVKFLVENGANWKAQAQKHLGLITDKQRNAIFESPFTPLGYCSELKLHLSNVMEQKEIKMSQKKLDDVRGQFETV